MQQWNNIQSFGSNQNLFTPTKNTNLFGDTSGGLFSNQQGFLFGNNNNSLGGGGLFSNQNQKATNSIFDNNTGNNITIFNNNTNIFSGNNNYSFNNNNVNLKECSIGSQFNGIEILEKNGNVKFMSIQIKPEFSYASQEELRLADLEKYKTGLINRFKIKNTSSSTNNNNNNLNKGSIFTSNTTNNIFSGTNPGSTSQGGIFGNNNNDNKNIGFFSLGNNKAGGLFDYNKNQTIGLFGNNNTQSSNLFGNNIIQKSNIFGNNNTQNSSLFGNNNNTQNYSIFDNNNTQTNSIFGNNNQNSPIFGNNTQSRGLFGDNNKKNTQNGGLFGNQGGRLFGNNNIFGNNSNQNNNTLSGGLFGNQNNNTSSTQTGNLFGNNNNPNQGGLFGNNNNQGNNLFNNDKNSFFINNNNDKKNNDLFGNAPKPSGYSLCNNPNITSATNNTSSLFANNLNNNNNKTGGNLFSNPFSGLLNNNNNTKSNDISKNTGNLFANNNFSFGMNTNATSSNNANANINKGGLLGNNSNNNNNNSLGLLFNQTNNTSSFTKEQSLFNNIGNNGSLFLNNNNNQNMNMNSNTPNNVNMANTHNSVVYGGLTLEDIVNPLNYLNNKKILKLSPQEEILSQSIIDAVQKQKSVEEFLEDLDKKYENKNKEKTNDLLEFYGSYFNTSNNYFSEKTTIKRNLNVKSNFDDSLSSSYILRKFNKKYNESSSIYNQNNLNKSISKISEIYNEYERIKNNFKYSQINNYTYINNTIYKKKTENRSFIKNLNKNGNRNNSFNKSFSKNVNNQMMAKDEILYQRNLIEFTKLSNDNIMTNNENVNDNDDNIDNVIFITNFQNENNSSKISNGKIENNNNKKGNMSHIIDMIIIKYNLPDEDDGKRIHRINLEGVNKFVKIESIREEISHRVNNQLRILNIHNKYSIERISLLVPGEFLIDNKTLDNYNLDDSDYIIQAYITYNSVKFKSKEESHDKKLKIEKEKKEMIQVNNDNELVSNDLLPKLTRKGYQCIPSIRELSKKTTGELKKMENFRIFNEFGEVVFKEPINLLGLDLDEQVTIEKNIIDTGDKLNCKSVFKLFNFKIGENGLNKYKDSLKKLGGNFLSYINNELVWEYNGNMQVKN